MAERRASLTEPRIENLLEQENSKFTLVTLASRRAREINDYYNQLGEGLGKIVPPQVTSVSRKPLSIALEEIEVGKIIKRDLPTEEELAAAAAEAELAAAGRRRPGRRRGLSHPWPRPTSGAVDASSSASPAGSRRTRPSSSAGGWSTPART